MKIALITPGISPHVMGGIQQHSFNFVRHLARLGVEIDLYHTDFGLSEGIEGLPGMTDAERKKITSLPVPWPATGRLPGHFVRELHRFSETVYARMRERDPVDLFYDQGMTGGALARARKGGAPVPPIVLNLHGYEMFQPTEAWNSRLQNLYTRSAYRDHARNCDFLISLGGRLTDLIQEEIGVARERIFELPNGVDSEWMQDSPSPNNSPRRFLFVGRYERRKGIEELQQVIRDNPQWSGCANFRFAGPIPEDKRLNLPYVSYAGAVSAMEALQLEYRTSDILLCPSHAEGMPTVILEAMASGLAVIATDVGATSTMVDEDNGILLADPAPAKIAAAIEEALAWTEDDLQRRRAASLMRVKQFDWSQVAEQTLACFEKILAIDARVNRELNR